MSRSRRVGRAATVLFVAVLVSGCGNGGSGDLTVESIESTSTAPPPSTTTTEPPSSTTATVPPSSTTTVPATTVGSPDDSADSISVLQQRDATPPGVQAQVETYVSGNGGGDPCPGPFPPGPGIRPLDWDPDATGVNAGGAKAFCLPGFNPSQPIALTLTAPSGGEVVLDVPALDERNVEALLDGYELFSENFAYWYVSPTVELGVHRANASQGGLLASALIEVHNASEPVMRLEGDYARTPGETLEFGLAGFSPGAVEDLHLYHLPVDDPEAELVSGYVFGTFRYITTLSVQFDELGRTTLILSTQPTDPEGGYGFFGATGSAQYGWFDAEFALISAG